MYSLKEYNFKGTGMTKPPDEAYEFKTFKTPLCLKMTYMSIFTFPVLWKTLS